jgi:eukaryotic-like serine/threonine-protein kinase
MSARSRSSAERSPDVDLPARYIDVRLLAAGGMGSVWCAQDTILRRSVAIKLLAEGYLGDGRAMFRFKREARAAAKLSGHPNVITIYDVGEAGGRPYMVMEYLAGGSVADAVRIGPIPREEAMRWIEEAGRALDHAHSHGILHRDVKPGNMLLSRDRVVHLGDFGIARMGAEDGVTSVGEVLGTASYIAPELLRGQPASEASDLYALAVTAFELLTGEKPVAADALTAAGAPVRSEAGRRLPTAAAYVLQAGMARDPAERWGSAAAFTTALEEALGYTSARAAETVPAGPSAAAAAEFLARRARRAPWPARSPRLARSARSAGSGGPDVVFASTRSRARPARAAAVSALIGAFVVLAAIVVGGGGGSHRNAALRAQARHPAAAAGPSRPARVAARPKPQTTPTVTSPQSAGQLEATGHQLMVSGEYAAAVPVLRHALSAAGPGNLTYAYALYDLGRSLRLGGDPAAAVPVLEQRLKIPDQPSVVRNELVLALREAGDPTATTTSSTTTTTSPPPTGAAGIGPPQGQDNVSNGNGPDGNGPPGHRHHDHGHGGGGGN